MIFQIIKNTKLLSAVQPQAYCYDTCFIASQLPVVFILLCFQHEQFLKCTALSLVHKEVAISPAQLTVVLKSTA